MIEILRAFADEQEMEDRDLPAARLPEPPRHRKVPGGEAVDIARPHHPIRQGS
jgi:hypothetical protein